MPGVGPGTAIELLRTVGDGSTFASAAHVASYAGLAPATRQSGRSITGEQQARHGNRSLRGALYISAFASLRHSASRAYYDRREPKGKGRTAALTRLARRRVDVLYSMLRDQQHCRAESFDPSPTPTSQPAPRHLTKPARDTSVASSPFCMGPRCVLPQLVLGPVRT